MKKILLPWIVCFLASTSFAQKQTYDLVSYTPPAGYANEVKENHTSYTITNREKKAWCQIFVVKSTTSKGGIEADFESEWQELAVKSYNPSGPPAASQVEEAEGWQVKSGSAKFVFDNSEAMVLLTTFSGYGRCVSVVSVTNSDDYSADITNFLGSIELAQPQTQQPVAPAINSAFAFNTTNFDDGWTSTVQEDWV
jgi:hypothetical protein